MSEANLSEEEKRLQQDELVKRLRAENEILRGLLPRLGAPCPYCGLTEMGKCASGFPGCAYADDLMVSGDEHSRLLLDRVRAYEARYGLQ